MSLLTRSNAAEKQITFFFFWSNKAVENLLEKKCHKISNSYSQFPLNFVFLYAITKSMLLMQLQLNSFQVLAERDKEKIITLLKFC